jgi:hypothetical protein
MKNSVALLIDADNISSLADVEEVFGHFRLLGATVSVRRAYGGSEKLVGMKEALKRHAVRLFVNQGKGTTDVTLVIDAMDLLHHAGLPGTVAIGSSDADFAPLAVRLREAGIRTMCFARREKADAEALALAYDEVVYLDAPARPEEPAPSSRRAPTAPARKKAAPVAPTRQAVAAQKAAVPKKSVAGKLDPDLVLAAVPGLRDRGVVPLNDVISQLRNEGILAKNGKAIAMLRGLRDHFKLTPEPKPTQIQWTGRNGR